MVGSDMSWAPDGTSRSHLPLPGGTPLPPPPPPAELERLIGEIGQLSAQNRSQVLRMRTRGVRILGIIALFIGFGQPLVERYLEFLRDRSLVTVRPGDDRGELVELRSRGYESLLFVARAIREFLGDEFGQGGSGRLEK